MPRINTRSFHVQPIPICLIIALAFLLTQCGRARVEQRIPQEEKRELDVIVPILSEELYVGPSELQCLKDDHRDRFKLGPANAMTYMGLRTLKFPVSEYLAALPIATACKLTSRDQRGVIVHYGLNSSDQFDVALQFVCLRWNGTTQAYDTALTKGYHVINNDTLVFMSGPISAWKGTFGERYAKRVLIQDSTNSQYRAFRDSMDVNSSVYPHENELALLIEQNSLLNRNLKIIPVAEPLSRTKSGGVYQENDFRQGICWLPDDILLLDPVTTGQSFKQKAADIGSPCPLDCPPLVKFKDKGLVRRDECKP